MIFVIVVVIHAMMYIIFVFFILLVLINATLEMEYNAQIMLNYLNNIVSYKFGSQCIYYSYDI